MADLLLELFSEEIPARMQARAADDLRLMMLEGLADQGLAPGEAEAHATPRRLVLAVEGLPLRSADVREERKGPRVGAPEKAIVGFLRGAGLAAITEARIVRDEKKGDFYVADIVKPGREAADIVAALVPQVVERFPWPKSMRWGAGRLRWVRPLTSILCLLDGRVVPFEVGGIASGAVTRGHRFLAPAAIEVTGFADYRKRLKAAKVEIDAVKRAELILHEARRIADEHGLELVEDEGLLRENAGLVEWPTVLIGKFDQEFLQVPGEVLTTSMKAHQKCFSLRDPKTDGLANRFLMVSNLRAKDGGEAIVAGNEKVIRARLSDAKFFFDQDLKRRLEPMHFELKGITFHEKLGTQWDRMERITELSRQIAGAVDAEPDLAGRAAQLAKADLVSGTVGEFPELQGLIGRYLAEAEHMNGRIAQAIEDHYRPKGAGDRTPMEPVSVAVALADKLDQLVGFWAIGEKPTGSGDPYQLRRAALGVIRIVLENDLRLPLFARMRNHAIALAEAKDAHKFDQQMRALYALPGELSSLPEFESLSESAQFHEMFGHSWVSKFAEGCKVANDLLAFFADRLKVYLREKGARHDLIDAVFALGHQDDLALVVKRVEALGEFLKSDDGANLLAGVKRAQNILRIEEKKDKASHDGTVDPALLKEPEEKTLAAAVAKTATDAEKAITVESFKGAMAALAELRAPVDAFFEKVTVNADDPKLRANRLRLLSGIRAATMKVADFSRIEG